MPTVYVVQNSLTRGPDGSLRPKHKTEDAARFGRVVDLLGPSASPWGRGVVDEMHRKLGEFTEEDFLVLIGSPVLIGYAFAIAADQTGGIVNVLQWDGKGDRYFPVKCDVAWPDD